MGEEGALFMLTSGRISGSICEVERVGAVVKRKEFLDMKSLEDVDTLSFSRTNDPLFDIAYRV